MRLAFVAVGVAGVVASCGAVDAGRAGSAAAIAPASTAPAERATFVVVHGAWGGAWDWRTVDSLLTAAGHRVHRVQLTGLGERVHLASPDIGLDTHIDDVVNTVLWEELRDVVLVGHSYGGMVITGVADRIPGRIRERVYVDALLPRTGESLLDLLGGRGGPMLEGARDGFLHPAWVPADAPVPRDVPQPLRTFTDTLRLTGAGDAVPGRYILTVAPGATSPDDFQPFADRAAARGWPVIRMEADHVPERSAPDALVKLLLARVAAAPDAAGSRQPRRTVVAIFAHPDDERIVAPLLARYAREGHDVHLVVATDGRLGVREHAGVPAGDALAAVRAEEARCAARELGIHPAILLGLEDAGLASFTALTRLRDGIRRVLRELRPDAILTFGPEGGTGHPDHRLVGAVATEVVQGGGDGIPDALYYASLPAERMADAPAARPEVTAIPERHLRVSVPFEAEDLVAAERAFACHASQYTAPERRAINAYLAHGFGGAVHLRPWDGAGARRTELFQP